MNVSAIDQTIRALCSDIEALRIGARDWRSLPEEELLYEAAICMFGSQMLFEVAAAAAERLRDAGLFNWLSTTGITRNGCEAEGLITASLSEPVSVLVKGKLCEVRPRMPNRLGSFLAATTESFHREKTSLGEIMSDAASATDARRVLIRKVLGFGPKQASLFLRRTGYSYDLAILDTHVLSYLRMTHRIESPDSSLSRLFSYERVEAEFKRVAAEFGYDPGCVDLAIWITMRVAKREALL